MGTSVVAVVDGARAAGFDGGRDDVMVDLPAFIDTVMDGKLAFFTRHGKFPERVYVSQLRERAIIAHTNDIFRPSHSVLAKLDDEGLKCLGTVIGLEWHVDAQLKGDEIRFERNVVLE